MNLKQIEIKECRVCKKKELTHILSLGNQFISDFTETGEGKTKIPLDLVLCNAEENGCGLLQLKHNIPGELMYKEYWYQSGINQTMKTALADITEKAEKIIKLNENDLVLDIGCNDGTLLRSYKSKTIFLTGFEPSNIFKYAKEGNAKIINDYFNFEAYEKEFGNKKAKIITSIAMFYDLPDPNKFVSDIKKILDEKGLWIIQMSYLPLMIEQNAFDNICHEHLEYYSLSALEFLLHKHELEIFDAELNDVNGGSFRVYIQHKNNGFKELTENKGNLEKLRGKEKEMNLNSKKTYEEFAERVELLKQKLIEFIKKEKQKGKKIYAYGASTKGNVLLQYYGLDYNLIDGAAERNPIKYGKKTIGTKIPIISEEEARKKADYFLVLPWHFIKEFIERENEFLEKGGKFILPLPEFKIIEK
ncbi:MAG: class I SAM-dependent methyltransferase [Candidatus Diapherotrites archaeon]|nr:class I SAM-dependent methyltransferase [Candidatus Diapherotrites archaeon]